MANRQSMAPMVTLEKMALLDLVSVVLNGMTAFSIFLLRYRRYANRKGIASMWVMNSLWMASLAKMVRSCQ